MTIKNIKKSWQTEQGLSNCDLTLSRGYESCLSTDDSHTTANTISLHRNKIPSYMPKMCF
jgi:hypothetical protein